MIFKIEIEFFSNILYFCINTHIIYPVFMHNDEKLKLHLIFRKKNCIIIQNKSFAGVMELADVPDSKSGGSDTVPVRPRSPAPENPVLRKRDFLIHCESNGISSMTSLLSLYLISLSGLYIFMLYHVSKMLSQ